MSYWCVRFVCSTTAAAVLILLVVTWHLAAAWLTKTQLEFAVYITSRLAVVL